MNIIRKSNQKNLEFRKSMELKVNGGSNTTVLSDAAVRSLNLMGNQSVTVGTDNGKVYLVKLEDNTGFTVKDNYINTNQFSIELLDTVSHTPRNNNFLFSLGEQVMINGMACWLLTLKDITPLMVRKPSTANIEL